MTAATMQAFVKHAGPVSDGTATMTAPLVPGIVVAMCLAVAVGYGVRAALSRARRGPRSGALVLPRSGSG